jgi:hypothetical protein
LVGTTFHVNVNFLTFFFFLLQLCLQTIASSAPIHNDLKEHIVNMCQNSTALLSKPRPPPTSQQQQQQQQQQGQMMPGSRMPIGPGATNRGLGNIGDPSATPIGGPLRQTPRSFLPGSSGNIEPLVGLTSQVNWQFLKVSADKLLVH